MYTLWEFTSGLVRLDAYAIAWEECKSTFGMYVKERKQSFFYSVGLNWRQKSKYWKKRNLMNANLKSITILRGNVLIHVCFICCSWLFLCFFYFLAEY